MYCVALLFVLVVYYCSYIVSLICRPVPNSSFHTFVQSLVQFSSIAGDPERQRVAIEILQTRARYNLPIAAAREASNADLSKKKSVPGSEPQQGHDCSFVRCRSSSQRPMRRSTGSRGSGHGRPRTQGRASLPFPCGWRRIRISIRELGGLIYNSINMAHNRATRGGGQIMPRQLLFQRTFINCRQAPS